MRSRLIQILSALFFILHAPAQTSETDSLEHVIRSGGREQAVLAAAALVQRYYTSGEPAKAQQLLASATRSATELGSGKALAAVYNVKGIMFYYESSFDSAMHYFRKALPLRMEAGDKEGTLRTISNIGGIYYMTMDNPRALKVYKDGLEKEREYGFEEGRFISINNIASIYANLRMNERALHYLRKAKRVYEKSGQQGHLTFTYDGLATAFRKQNKFDSALIYAKKGIDLCEKLNEKSGAAYARVQLGVIYNTMKDYAAAERTLQEALQEAVQLEDKRLELGIYGNLAAVALYQNDTATAGRHLRKLQVLQDELRYKKNDEDLSKLYADYYYRKGDFSRAYDMMMVYDRLRDSIYSLETSGQLLEMQEKFETEKKEQENRILQAENQGHRTTRNYLLLILGLALALIAGGFAAFVKIRRSNVIITHQKQLVEEKQKEIIDSISYARRIQFALLTGDAMLRSNLPEHFVLFKPKDVVSGDFYWAAAVDDGFVYVTGDCTGHGVPGAFMSLLNISKLSQAVNETRITRPDEILNKVREEIVKALNPEGSAEESKDGMDAIVCKLKMNERKLEFAAANNSFYVVRDGAILHCRADKMPVGKSYEMTPFTHNELALQAGDVVYTFTDGYADQFGGAAGKKFKYKQLEQLILSIHREPMHVQKQALEEAFEKWRGSLEQVDDVCILGVRIV